MKKLDECKYCDEPISWWQVKLREWTNLNELVDGYCSFWCCYNDGFRHGADFADEQATLAVVPTKPTFVPVRVPNPTKKATMPCLFCKVEFLAYRIHDRKYCSKSCMSQHFHQINKQIYNPGGKPRVANIAPVLEAIPTPTAEIVPIPTKIHAALDQRARVKALSQW